MRMWMLPPEIMCDQHLLGEHNEIHKHRHGFVKGHSVAGRISPIIQIQPKDMEKRHDEVVDEMLRRGMNHYSPFEQPSLKAYSLEIQNTKVDIKYNLIDLQNRCCSCKKRILNNKDILLLSAQTKVL